MLRDAPNDVQLKYSCLVSNGNRKGQDWFKFSHQFGNALLESTSGS